MNQMIEAVYENGVLRPLTALHGLTEGQKVLVALKLSAERNSSTEVSCQDAEFLQELEAEGLLDCYSWSRGPAPEAFNPLEAIGKPLSQIILEDRE